MKKRILAVVLALSLLAGCCILFASALEESKVSVDDLIDAATIEDASKVLESGTDFNIKVTAKEKTSSKSLPVGTTQIKASNVDKIVEFTANGKKVSFLGNLSNSFDVSGTVSVSSSTQKGSVTVTFTQKTNPETVPCWQVGTGKEVNAVEEDNEPVKYASSISKVNVSEINMVDNFSKLIVGVRFYGKAYDNLSADEIAVVDALITRTGTPKAVKAVSNEITDLRIGDTVTLTTRLKDPADKAYYQFSCWVDGKGNVLQANSDGSYTVTVDGTDQEVRAAYVEIVNRYTITYRSNGNGKLAVVRDGEILEREIFDGNKAQISVLEGKTVEFVITPDDAKYEIASVKITNADTGETYDAASFKSLVSSNILKRLSQLIQATGADRQLGSDSPAVGSYKFEDVHNNWIIDVKFREVAPIEAPSGLDLPTVAAEGIELETGAADANGEGGNGSATTVPAENGVAGNGGSAEGGIVNPATGSGSAVVVFAVLTAAAGAAFVTMKKKED